VAKSYPTAEIEQIDRLFMVCCTKCLILPKGEIVCLKDLLVKGGICDTGCSWQKKK